MAVEVNQLHLKDINLHDNTPLVEVNQAFWDDHFRQKRIQLDIYHQCVLINLWAKSKDISQYWFIGNSTHYLTNVDS